MLELLQSEMAEVKRIKPNCLVDERGFFMETFSEKEVNLHFCQDNLSFSKKAGTLRGLHFQMAPFAQTKLVYVLQGGILDVAVDIRLGSKNFGKYTACILSKQNREQLLIPEGFAHGFITLEPNTLVAYKVSAFYSKEHERGILWSDPDLNIPWPEELLPPTLSEKDGKLPWLKELSL